jgi:hypothetical protein
MCIKCDCLMLLSLDIFTATAVENRRHDCRIAQGCPSVCSYQIFGLIDARAAILRTLYSKKLNSVALVRERTIPIDRRLSAKLVPTFADRGVSHGQRNGSPRPESLLFLPSSSPFVLTKLSGIPFQTRYFSENVVVPRNRTRTSGSEPGTMTTRPQRRSNIAFCVY